MRCQVPLATPRCPPGPKRGRVAGGREGEEKGERGRRKGGKQREGRELSLIRHFLPKLRLTFSMRSSHKFWFHVFFLFWPERQGRGWREGDGEGRKEERTQGGRREKGSDSNS